MAITVALPTSEFPGVDAIGGTLAVSPDGRWFVSVNSNGAVQFFSAHSPHGDQGDPLALEAAASAHVWPVPDSDGETGPCPDPQPHMGVAAADWWAPQPTVGDGAVSFVAVTFFDGDEQTGSFAVLRVTESPTAPTLTVAVELLEEEDSPRRSVKWHPSGEWLGTGSDGCSASMGSGALFFWKTNAPTAAATGAPLAFEDNPFDRSAETVIEGPTQDAVAWAPYSTPPSAHPAIAVPVMHTLSGSRHCLWALDCLCDLTDPTPSDAGDLSGHCTSTSSSEGTVDSDDGLSDDSDTGSTVQGGWRLVKRWDWGRACAAVAVRPSDPNVFALCGTDTLALCRLGYHLSVNPSSGRAMLRCPKDVEDPSDRRPLPLGSSLGPRDCDVDPSGVAWSSDGTLLAVASSASCRVYAVGGRSDCEGSPEPRLTATMVHCFGTLSGVLDVSWAGPTLAVSFSDGSVVVTDTSALEVASVLPSSVPRRVVPSVVMARVVSPFVVAATSAVSGKRPRTFSEEHSEESD